MRRVACPVVVAAIVLRSTLPVRPAAAESPQGPGWWNGVASWVDLLVAAVRFNTERVEKCCDRIRELCEQTRQQAGPERRREAMHEAATLARKAETWAILADH